MANPYIFNMASLWVADMAFEYVRGRTQLTGHQGSSKGKMQGVRIIALKKMHATLAAAVEWMTAAL